MARPMRCAMCWRGWGMTDMHIVVQEGLKEEIKFDRYRDAVAKFNELVAAEPAKKCGVFLMGDDAALHWHHGNFLTSQATR